MYLQSAAELFVTAGRVLELALTVPVMNAWVAPGSEQRMSSLILISSPGATAEAKRAEKLDTAHNNPVTKPSSRPRLIWPQPSTGHLPTLKTCSAMSLSPRLSQQMGAKASNTQSVGLISASATHHCRVLSLNLLICRMGERHPLGSCHSERRKCQEHLLYLARGQYFPSAALMVTAGNQTCSAAQTTLYTSLGHSSCRWAVTHSRTAGMTGGPI